MGALRACKNPSLWCKFFQNRAFGGAPLGRPEVLKNPPPWAIALPLELFAPPPKKKILQLLSYLHALK